jgi:hypothetical protein
MAVAVHCWRPLRIDEINCIAVKCDQVEASARLMSCSSRGFGLEPFVLWVRRFIITQDALRIMSGRPPSIPCGDVGKSDSYCRGVAITKT